MEVQVLSPAPKFRKAKFCPEPAEGLLVFSVFSGILAIPCFPVFPCFRIFPSPNPMPLQSQTQSPTYKPTRLARLKSSLATLPQGWCCYILLCSDNSYYCGAASNLPNRILDHSYGKGSLHTKQKRPLALLWYEEHSGRASALKRELQLKNWTHAKKQKLVSGLDPTFRFGHPTNFFLP